MTTKRVLVLALIVGFCILTNGCARLPIESSEKIVPPHNRHIPIEGTWEMVKNLGKDITSQHDDTLIGTLAVFDKDKLIFGDEIFTGIQYTIKRVGTDDFFFYQYRIRAEDLGISNEEVDVVSVSSNNKIFYEFIKLDDANIMATIDNNFYVLKKQSDVKDMAFPGEDNKVENSGSDEESPEPDLLRSGILLGLRGISGDIDEGYEITYRTLWIRSENRNLHPILETSNILAPRKTGFWDIGSRAEQIDGYTYDFLYAYPSFLHDKPQIEHDLDVEILRAPSMNLPNNSHLRRHIEYVGNDYIAVEDISVGDDSTIINRRYKVLPIDNVQNSNGVKISDIAGEIGRDALLSSTKSSLEINNLKDIEALDDELDEGNFTVARRNGHWIMRGRTSYSDERDMVEYLDFNINIIPPVELVSYDELCISWNTIKSKLPSAIDAYSSPNEDMLIVLDLNNLYVYSVDEQRLSDRPMYKVSLHEGEKVVMAEWATGTYTERWDKYFRAKNPTKLDEE